MGLGLVATPAAWVEQVERDPLALLSDHACELKAAASGQALVGKNPNFPRLVDEVSAVVVEEMEHFQLVVAELGAGAANSVGSRTTTPTACTPPAVLTS